MKKDLTRWMKYKEYVEKQNIEIRKYNKKCKPSKTKLLIWESLDGFRDYISNNKNT